MADKLQILKHNEVYLQLKGEKSLLREISDHFTFDVPNAKYSPKFKAGVWDGKIKLLNYNNQLIYCGLLKDIEDYCLENDVEIEYLFENGSNEFSVNEAKKFIKSINLPKYIGKDKFEMRDYQLETFISAVRNKRELYLSAVNSGKSFIIYLILRYLMKKTLIITSRVNLVSQLYDNFEEYNFDSEKYCHKIYSETEKNSDKLIHISTYQSAILFSKEQLAEYEVIIGDECHHYESKVTKELMESLTSCEYRFGFTGSLNDSKTHKLVLSGLFGQIKNVISSAEMIEKGYSSDFKIKAIVLKYSKKTIDDFNTLVNQSKNKLDATQKYQAETLFLINNKRRNQFILNLAESLDGNILILFNRVEKHGDILYDSIKENVKDKQVFFISGKIKTKDRDIILEQVKNSNNCILLASYGTFSEGIDVKNLHNLIFASSFKGKVKNIQSIGRVLRKTEGKDKAVLFDIVDDLSSGSNKNYSLTHFMERVRIYSEEKFQYKLYSINLFK